MKKVICSLLVVTLCLCGAFVNYSYVSAASQIGTTTESGYSYAITVEDDKPNYWIISTPDNTRPTYECSTIDSRDLGMLLSYYADSVDELKDLEEEYESTVKDIVFKLIPLTLASHLVPTKAKTAEVLAVILPGFTAADVEDAIELYNEIIEAREECDKRFDAITYTISR